MARAAGLTLFALCTPERFTGGAIEALLTRLAVRGDVFGERPSRAQQCSRVPEMQWNRARQPVRCLLRPRRALSANAFCRRY